jgi:hypothetical protein
MPPVERAVSDSEAFHIEGDAWDIVTYGDGYVKVWCGNPWNDNSEELTPAEARRMADQLRAAADAIELAP